MGNVEEILNSRVVCKERIPGTWEFVEDDGKERVKSLTAGFLSG